MKFKSPINIHTDKWGDMIIVDEDGNNLSGWYRKGRNKEIKEHLKQLRKERSLSKKGKKCELFYILNSAIGNI